MNIAVIVRSLMDINLAEAWLLTLTCREGALLIGELRNRLRANQCVLILEVINDIFDAKNNDFQFTRWFYFLYNFRAPILHKHINAFLNMGLMCNLTHLKLLAELHQSYNTAPLFIEQNALTVLSNGHIDQFNFIVGITPDINLQNIKVPPSYQYDQLFTLSMPEFAHTFIYSPLIWPNNHPSIPIELTAQMRDKLTCPIIGTDMIKWMRITRKLLQTKTSLLEIRQILPNSRTLWSEYFELYIGPNAPLHDWQVSAKTLLKIASDYYNYNKAIHISMFAAIIHTSDDSLFKAMQKWLMHI